MDESYVNVVGTSLAGSGDMEGQTGSRRACLNGHDIVEYYDSPLQSIRWKCTDCNRAAEILDEYIEVGCNEAGI